MPKEEQFKLDLKPVKRSWAEYTEAEKQAMGAIVRQKVQDKGRGALTPEERAFFEANEAWFSPEDDQHRPRG